MSSDNERERRRGWSADAVETRASLADAVSALRMACASMLEAVGSMEPDDRRVVELMDMRQRLWAFARNLEDPGYKQP